MNISYLRGVRAGTRWEQLGQHFLDVGQLEVHCYDAYNCVFGGVGPRLSESHQYT